MQEILKDAIGADSVDYAAHVTESVLARVHFVVRMKQGQTVGEFDADLLEQRIVEATRAWQRRLRRGAGEEGRRGTAPGCAAGYAERVPGGVQGGLRRPRSRSSDV